MQARPEGRTARHLRHGGDDARPAGRTAHRQTPMMRDEGLHRGQLDPFVHADRLRQQVRAERHSAAGALDRTVLDDLIGRLAHHSAVALVAGLGSARLGFLPLILAIRRGRLGGGARGLLRPLQAQNQLDQLFLAQTLKLATTHPALESAKTANLKGVGNYAWCTDRSAGAEELSGVGERPRSCPWIPIVPFKLNQDRRHHIPRQRRKVTNWPAYDASLRQRGSLTVWFTEEAVDAWAAEPRTTRGGQPWYSALAILTALTVRAVFRLAFRQTEGLIGSIIGRLGLTLRGPGHPTPSRRAPNGARPPPPGAGGPKRWTCRSRGGPAPRLGARPSPCTCWWTARGSSCAGPANGCWRSTAPARGGRGESCISAWTPIPARSSPPR